MHVFELIIAYMWLIWIFYWFISAIGTKRNIRNTNWFLSVGFRIAIIAIVFLALKIPVLNQFITHIHTESFYNNLYVSILGIFISIIGFSLTVWSRINLGKNWGMPMSVKEKPNLITSGPYAIIRHPIYTGIIFAMVGTTLATTIYWLIPLVFTMIYFIISSIIEEKDLLKQFPSEYKKYLKKTKSFIPYFY